MRVAFWNTHKNTNINEHICNVIYENVIDIMILAEYKADVRELLCALNKMGVKMSNYLLPGCDRITIVGNIDDIEPASQNAYYSLLTINKSRILACVHLPSKLNANRDKKDIVIEQIVLEITKLEEDLHTEETIVVGDFNENPYESGCLGAKRFHGLPCYEDAKRNVRTVMRRPFKMFYNPMWNFMGDFSFPMGTYYYNGNDEKNPYWNIYDQVMIRPVLRNCFKDEELKILEGTKNYMFVDLNRRPNKAISDHLPLLFEVVEDDK